MLGTTDPAHQDDLTRRHISRANLQPHRHTPQFPLVKLPPRSVGLTVIQLHPELGAQRLGKIPSRSKDFGFVFPENGDDDDVVRCDLRCVPRAREIPPCAGTTGWPAPIAPRCSTAAAAAAGRGTIESTSRTSAG